MGIVGNDHGDMKSSAGRKGYGLVSHFIPVVFRIRISQGQCLGIIQIQRVGGKNFRHIQRVCSRCLRQGQGQTVGTASLGLPFRIPITEVGIRPQRDITAVFHTALFKILRRILFIRITVPLMGQKQRFILIQGSFVQKNHASHRINHCILIFVVVMI